MEEDPTINNQNLKTIFLPEKKINTNNHVNRELKQPKKYNKRMVTNEKRWISIENDYVIKNQIEYIDEILYKTINNIETFNKMESLIVSEINHKITGYKSQDIKKQLYDPTNFIKIETVLNKMKDVGLQCFYCKEPVLILYEIVREPKQWTLERIDNSFGHNSNNVEIACLHCNLHRRTMYHERFIFTKQLNIIKHA